MDIMSILTSSYEQAMVLWLMGIMIGTAFKYMVIDPLREGEDE